MKVAVVGATGMVGREMLRLLAQRAFPVKELYVVASERSAGSKVEFNGKKYEVITLQDLVEKDVDLALFSAGGSTSKKWAPILAKKGVTVIDNSSAWRMDENVKLLVPEINAHLLTKEDKIIANPNCSTIQLVMALNPLHKAFSINRVVVSTYQSISGTGKAAVEQMLNERKGIKGEMAYPYTIDQNCLPHCDVFLDNDYTKEEMKLTNESKKILGDKNVQVVATAVRVPVVGGHSEAVNIEFNSPFELSEIRKLLHETKGIKVQDNPDTNTYPMPLFAHGKDEVFVGRIRRDFTREHALNLWIVSDNLRKGAATNAIQIAEYLVDKSLIQ